MAVKESTQAVLVEVLGKNQMDLTSVEAALMDLFDEYAAAIIKHDLGDEHESAR